MIEYVDVACKETRRDGIVVGASYDSLWQVHWMLLLDTSGMAVQGLQG